MNRRSSGTLMLGLVACDIAVACSRAPMRIADAPARRDSVAFPADWPYPAGERATFARHAIVASNSRLASEAGVRVLRAGGNAVDAAVAVGFALAVVYPEAGNLAGSGYMMLRMNDGRVAALDFREVAPLAAKRDMFVTADGQLSEDRLIGHRAAAVPGTVAGFVEAHRRYGRRPLREVLAPAIDLAADGFVVDSILARSLWNNRAVLSRFGAAAIFAPRGEPLRAGTLLRQPDLARTLMEIRDHGADGFYRGQVARLIAEEMARGGGLVTEYDLERYAAKWRTPLRTSYRGHTLVMMPPSSSGGATITETLNIVEKLGPLSPFGSTARIHVVAAAFQRAFIDRNAELGDPDYASVDLSGMLDKGYASRLARTIEPLRAARTSELENERRALSRPEGSETTPYSVIDAQGNAVAVTVTLNDSYGSGVFTRGGGFFMSNSMDDFSTRVGSANLFGLVQGEKNAIAPGKRMLSSMSPTIVLDPEGRVLLLVGGRGGPRIITAITQVILNLLDDRMPLADAIAAPRVHHQGRPDTLFYEPNGLSRTLLDSLTAIGYVPEREASHGRITAVIRVPGGWQGWNDPRIGPGVAGY